ncbi:MAG TPA: class I SAM-dependent methyltransferase [Actinophytocola sp.]|uniref:class I SAM-dependent methyltransferase n=1 Tax=Actinophytocola sp. TaxID=1872138 RepID=UPI002DDD5CB2|nr:class I SAM-dependent methyltransferase [Actinophytocola sp.]HEV2778442.1 class I SAM-dependent methyltransferase [Actinophytocola sp.]
MPSLHHARAHKAGAFRHPAAYDRLARRARRLHARVVADVAAAGLADGARVLDAGTGPGRVPLAIAAARPGLRVEGIDLSGEMIEHARRLAVDAGVRDRVGFTVSDVADLSYPDGTFDLIVSTLSQHHWADVGGGIRELRRVVKPTGQIWIYDIRFALRRAEAAARAVSPRCDVGKEVVRTGPLSLGLIARLTIRPTG